MDYSMKDRQEDLGLLIGVSSVSTALDKAISSIWLPFWANLPKQLCTPKNLVHNKEIIYSMIEAVGSTIVTEKIDLEDQLKHYKQDSLYQRTVLMTTLTTMARFASSCEAFDVSYSPEDKVDISSDETFPSDEDDLSGYGDPMWKVCLTLVNARGTERITHIITHAEFVAHFAPIATVVKSDPDPDFSADFDGVFADLNPATDDTDFTDGPTLR